MQPTALVNEAYIRLVRERGMAWRDRAHFLAVAAQLMRFILVDHARRHRYKKRGGGAPTIALDIDVEDPRPAGILAIDGALDDLARSTSGRRGWSRCACLAASLSSNRRGSSVFRLKP